MASTLGLLPASGLKGTGGYGPHCTYFVDEATGVATLTAGGAEIASVTPSGGATVNLTALNPLTVAPVNVFIAPHGVVKKYWRTGEYRLHGATGPVAAPKSPARKSVAPKAVALTSTPVAPTPVAPAPVVTIAPTGDIPGLRVLPKVTAKAMAKGYSRIGEIIAKTRDHETACASLALRRAGHPAAMLITGPAGTAKTRFAEAFAASQGLPFLKIDGGSIRTADDWFGSMRQDAATGRWEWRPSPFTMLMDARREAVVLVDEINRVESERALNGLYGLLDGTGTVYVPDAGRTITMPPGILVMATANIGPEFIGTIPLDGALRDRLPWGVRMEYPVEAVEVKLLGDLTGVGKETAERLVRVANTQREKRHDPIAYPSRSVISTRVLVDVARRITIAGAEPREALWGALRGRFSPEDEPSLSVCVDAQFPTAPVEDEGEITEVDLIGL
jgi:MoxR-like ATPase